MSGTSQRWIRSSLRRRLRASTSRPVCRPGQWLRPGCTTTSTKAARVSRPRSSSWQTTLVRCDRTVCALLCRRPGAWLRAGIRGQCIQNATFPSHLCTFPSYLDPRYQSYFLRAVDRFAQHIASLPHSVRSKIIASQAMYGTTGDDSPWHGMPADPQQNICFRPDSPGYSEPCKRVGQFADEWHNVRERSSRSVVVLFSLYR